MNIIGSGLVRIFEEANPRYICIAMLEGRENPPQSFEQYGVAYRLVCSNLTTACYIEKGEMENGN